MQDKQNTVLSHFYKFCFVKVTGNNEWTLKSPREKFPALCQTFCTTSLIFPLVAQSHWHALDGSLPQTVHFGAV